MPSNRSSQKRIMRGQISVDHFTPDFSDTQGVPILPSHHDHL